VREEPASQRPIRDQSVVTTAELLMHLYPAVAHGPTDRLLGMQLIPTIPCTFDDQLDHPERIANDVSYKWPKDDGHWKQDGVGCREVSSSTTNDAPLIRLRHTALYKCVFDLIWFDDVTSPTVFCFTRLTCRISSFVCLLMFSRSFHNNINSGFIFLFFISSIHIRLGFPCALWRHFTFQYQYALLEYCVLTVCSAWWWFASASDLQLFEARCDRCGFVPAITSQRLRTCARTPMRNCLMLSPLTALCFTLPPPPLTLKDPNTTTYGNVHTTSNWSSHGQELGLHLTHAVFELILALWLCISNPIQFWGLFVVLMFKFHCTRAAFYQSF